DRQIRDEFVQQVFASAKLPLARIPVQASYVTAQLNTLLRQQAGLNDINVRASSAPAAPVVMTPRCPKCGTEMVLRTAKSGANAGGQFWGCPDYPHCRGIVSYETTSATVST
ncbi:MAG TPA: topoisomerase DNA-binding C4 zinc finger domain-containing protein, partial [Anaerolineae bacterium]